MNLQDLTLTLVESFNALADEVQNLNDRQTILEHKLRFAHEQFQYLADKHAPAAPEISETLVKLQIPPELHNQSLANTNFVPLPKRNNAAENSKHQIALIIREGRRVASSLTATDFSKSGSQSSREDHDVNDVNNYHYYNTYNTNNNINNTSRPPTTMTSLSTILEQDFTVEGKRRGNLECPFSVSPPKLDDPRAIGNGHDEGDEREGGHDDNDGHNTAAAAAATTTAAAHHDTSDPICAAMLFEDHDHDHDHDHDLGGAGGSQPTTSGAVKCPIRFMDHHSAEEIAHYLETHKHELPRSHEVCVRRYQKSEEQVKKLDAKYGNLANMVEGLGRIHQPMLPEQDTRPQSDVEKVSNERVENWAQTVSATVTDDPDHPDHDRHDAAMLLLEHERGSSEGGRRRRGEGEGGDRNGDGDGDDDGQGDERQGRFDRPLKEVRVGESPSRPWGISVPVYDYDTPSGRRGERGERPESPPPAPVPMPPSALPLPLSSSSNSHPATPPTTKGERKCPFDHATMRQMMGGGGGRGRGGARTPIKREDDEDESSVSVPLENIPPPLPPSPSTRHQHDHDHEHEPFKSLPPPGAGAGAGAGRGGRHASGSSSSRRPPQQPAFLNAPDVTRPKLGGGNGGGSGRSGTPQMLFTGPVFIGYPVEQAIQIIQAFQGQQQ
ncbi:hypothetical protein SLS62_008513 [Diatrype stigma]|uniref:Uncharacterized protein n=1 Tax=Diatrype stigma TaxID=117547 RepID=A0AAN9YKE1_9PEZI